MDIEKEIQKEKIKEYVGRETNIRRNTEKAFVVVWGQCSAALHSYIKGLINYEEKSTNFDILWLFTELKKAVSGIDEKENPHLILHEAIASLYKMKQLQTEWNDHYLKRFKSNINTVERAKGEHSGGAEQRGTRTDSTTPADRDREREKERSKAGRTAAIQEQMNL